MAPPNAALHTRTRVSTPFELMMRKSVRKIGGTSPSCAASMRMPSCAAVNSLHAPVAAGHYDAPPDPPCKCSM
eukprot:scaffold12059_cov208-Isochrysis_galbana.AAC.1